MRLRPVLALAVVVALPLGAGAASAATPLPVTVSRTSDGGVAVGSQVGSQPLLGVTAGPSGVCAGFSLQVTHCVPLSVGTRR